MIETKGFECELCKGKLPLEVKTSYGCSDLTKVKDKIGGSKGMFLLLLFFICSGAGMLIFLLKNIFSKAKEG